MPATAAARAGWAVTLAVGMIAGSLLADAARVVPPSATAMGMRDTQAPAPAPVPEAAPALARIVALTNAERARVGVAPLAVDVQLTVAAQRYAEVMAASGCFGHACGAPPRLADRAVAAGDARWGYLGENVAVGQPTPERAVAAWMASPSHRAVLLDPEFTRLGVGQARGGVYGVYWTQEFGAPAAGVPVEAPAA